MPLDAEDSVQKILLSSTSRFVGEYRANDFILAHAWPALGTRDSRYRDREGPLSRNSFVFSFITQQATPRPGLVDPDYNGVGEMVASYLSVLFGKRFDSHGAFESSGSFRLPDFSEYSQICSPWLPQNSHSPRVDLQVPLDLKEVSRLAPLLRGTVEPTRVASFRTACLFYMRALHASERDPEVAYLHLVTIGELLAAQQQYDKRELLDADVLGLLDFLRDSCADGDKMAKVVESRLFQVKRAFVRVLAEFVDDEFFSRREARNDYEALKKETFEKTVKAAYDLRSRYVHVGTPFSGWVSSTSGHLEEVLVGEPHLRDKELAKVLQRAPTLVGLERIMRYALFRFAQRAGLIQPPPVEQERTVDAENKGGDGVPP